jgi:hypothetical protein
MNRTRKRKGSEEIRTIFSLEILKRRGRIEDLGEDVSILIK